MRPGGIGSAVRRAAHRVDDGDDLVVELARRRLAEGGEDHAEDGQHGRGERGEAGALAAGRLLGEDLLGRHASGPGPDAALRRQRAHAARRGRRVERVAIDGARQPIAGGEQQVEERRGDAQAGLDAPAPGELGGCGRCHGRGLYG